MTNFLKKCNDVWIKVSKRIKKEYNKKSTINFFCKLNQNLTVMILHIFIPEKNPEVGSNYIF